MQKTITLCLILFVLFCKDKKNSQIWEIPKPASLKPFFFDYGIKPQREVEVNPEKSPKIKFVFIHTMIFLDQRNMVLVLEFVLKKLLRIRTYLILLCRH